VRFAIAMTLVIAAACVRQAADAPPCATVALRFETVMEDAIGDGGVGPAVARDVSAQVPAIRDTLARACEADRWSAAVRTCFVYAVTRPAYEACESQLTDDQRISFAHAVP
jgi:hypothetical protein